MPVVIKIGQSKCVASSVMEGIRSSGVICAQCMLCIMRIVESMELTFKKSMKLHIDNKVAVDLVKKW